MATCIALEGVSFKQTHKAVGRLQCVCVCEALRLANTLAGLVHDGRSVIIYVYAQTHKITEHIALSCTGQQCVQVLCTVQHTSCL